MRNLKKCNEKWKVCYIRLNSISHVCNSGHKAEVIFALHTESRFMLQAGPLIIMSWNVSWGIWRAFWTSYYASEAQILLGEDFCDADWAGDANNHWSTVGYEFLIGIIVILWTCMKQPTIALSTSHCSKKVVWFDQLLTDVGYMQERPTSIMWHNHECIVLAKNSTYHFCIKYTSVQKKLKTRIYV